VGSFRKIFLLKIFKHPELMNILFLDFFKSLELGFFDFGILEKKSGTMVYCKFKEPRDNTCRNNIRNMWHGIYGTKLRNTLRTHWGYNTRKDKENFDSSTYLGGGFGTCL
jgi:hypothetical protein